MSNNNSGKSNTGMIIAIVAVVVLLIVSSSGLGGVGYMQGWFGGGGGGGAITDPLPADTTPPADPAAASVNYQGLSTSCAISYKPASDQFNTAVPPFDPSKCQGIEIESNCQTWTPVQQGTTWQWQKSNNIDGCVPVQPDTVGVAKGQLYMTDAGPVVPFPTTSVSPNPSDPNAPQTGGGYGKDGIWRNAADSKQIVALARSGRLRSGGRTSSSSVAKMAVARATAAPRRTVVSRTTKPAVRRANADPAPMRLNSPAYAEFAPYVSGLLN